MNFYRTPLIDTDYTEQPLHGDGKWSFNELVSLRPGGFFSETRSTIEAAYVRPRNLQWPLFQEKLGDIIHEV